MPDYLLSRKFWASPSNILLSLILFSECDSLPKADIIELIEAKNKEIEAKTKMIEAKCVSEINLVKAKCLSKAEIIELIDNDCRNNPCQNGKCIDLVNDYRCECPTFYSGRNCDVKQKCGNGYAGKNCNLPCPVNNPLLGWRIVDGTCIR